MLSFTRLTGHVGRRTFAMGAVRNAWGGSAVRSSFGSRSRNDDHGGRRGQRSGAGMLGAGALLAVAAGSMAVWANSGDERPRIAFAAEVDYLAVKNDIESLLDNENYDDGSYGPVLVRLAWHASGTYNKEDGSGGSDGATMRFDPEASHGANAGLKIARDLLEPIKAKYPGLSYGDLWTLAGVVAIAHMGGPEIPWRAGRRDAVSGKECTPDGRLPDGSKGSSHLRDIFYRMGFNDQEIVALAGAHALGRCHADRSGNDGPWTKSPTMFSNDFFHELLRDPPSHWTERKWRGPKQYEDPDKELMMLPADLSVRDDPAFRVWAEKYAADEELFFADFAAAFQKLEELGVKSLHETPIFPKKKKAWWNIFG